MPWGTIAQQFKKRYYQRNRKGKKKKERKEKRNGKGKGNRLGGEREKTNKIIQKWVKNNRMKKKNL